MTKGLLASPRSALCFDSEPEGSNPLESLPKKMAPKVGPFSLAETEGFEWNFYVIEIYD